MKKMERSNDLDVEAECQLFLASERFPLVSVDLILRTDMMKEGRFSSDTCIFILIRSALCV